MREDDAPGLVTDLNGHWDPDRNEWINDPPKEGK